MSGPSLTVVPFTAGNVNDIPAGLRNPGDLIEAGCAEGAIRGLTDAVTLVWVAVNEAGDIETGALGKCANRYHGAGLMHAAASQLAGAKP